MEDHEHTDLLERIEKLEILQVWVCSFVIFYKLAYWSSII